jgi:two-component system heavy metal sensor histidine kinase CusS
LKRRLSLTLRLTLLFAAASTGVLLVLGLLIAHFVERHFVELDQQVLEGKLELVRAALQQRQGPGSAGLPERLRASLVGHHGLALAVLDQRGAIVFANTDVVMPRELTGRAWTGARSPPVTWSDRGRPYRGVAEFLAAGEEAGHTIAVATDISHHRTFQSAFRWVLGLFVGCAALLMGVLGWLSVGHGLAPLKSMSERASRITADRLDLRMGLEEVPVELEELAATLNRMLARLEDSFRRLSEASSDMAHELRTPVAALMTQTQVALSRKRGAEEYREVLVSCAEELDRLARTISEMLFLAKAENGLVIPAREFVDLGREVDELFDFYGALAEERRVRMRRDGQALVPGDRLMLRRALSNLLSNAIRHTAAGGEIAVRLGESAHSGVEICVDNPGLPVPAAERERLFERFHRADPSRRREGEGAGLGLAITRSIVRAHGGTIDVDSSEGITRFTMRIPASAVPPG